MSIFHYIIPSVDYNIKRVGKFTSLDIKDKNDLLIIKIPLRLIATLQLQYRMIVNSMQQKTSSHQQIPIELESYYSVSNGRHWLLY